MKFEALEYASFDFTTGAGILIGNFFELIQGIYSNYGNCDELYVDVVYF